MRFAGWRSHRLPDAGHGGDWSGSMLANGGARYGRPLLFANWHIPDFEDLGIFDAVPADAGYGVRYHDLDRHPLQRLK